ncbi:MAG: LexA family transcriptional regulator [Holophagaceae bacterium]|nr:LexA family transcriptional regulator [Holophagaceae bacterium]
MIDPYSPHFRLRYARTLRGFSLKDFGAKIKVSNQAVSNWEKGKTPISVRVAQAIEMAHGIRSDWLLYGKGEMANRDDVTSANFRLANWINSEERRNARVEVPVFSSLAPPEGDACLDDYFGQDVWTFDGRWLEELFFPLNPYQFFLFRISGDSMAPTFLDREMVFVDGTDFQAPLKEGGIWLLEIDKAVFVKRIQQTGSDSFQAICDNTQYKPIRLDGTAKVLGRVIGSSPRRH